jgi:hypothetical protein
MKSFRIIFFFICTVVMTSNIDAQTNDLSEKNLVWKQDYQGLDANRMKKVITLEFEVIFHLKNL